MWQSWHWTPSRAKRLAFHSRYVFSRSLPFSALAELGAQERGSAGHAVVRERLAWRGRGERPVAARRAEPLVGTDVTARAHEPSGAEGGIVNRVRASSRAVGDARRLLGEGRVAREAAQR
ncbi:MAG: hypothetical protein DME11_02070 [Candidatus Rokuibacteriota bacterium]|nr:MAG: hypothetical protein DME11_02070 [Candidatus Rokubacteria bacterium]